MPLLSATDRRPCDPLPALYQPAGEAARKSVILQNIQTGFFPGVPYRCAERPFASWNARIPGDALAAGCTTDHGWGAILSEHTSEWEYAADFCIFSVFGIQDTIQKRRESVAWRALNLRSFGVEGPNPFVSKGTFIACLSKIWYS